MLATVVCLISVAVIKVVVESVVVLVVVVIVVVVPGVVRGTVGISVGASMADTGDVGATMNKTRKQKRDTSLIQKV